MSDNLSKIILKMANEKMRIKFFPLQFKMATFHFLVVNHFWKSLISNISNSLAHLCENFQNVSADHNFATKKPIIVPLLPRKYKGRHWSVKVCQRALQTYLTILGTYNSNKEMNLNNFIFSQKVKFGSSL